MSRHDYQAHYNIIWEGEETYAFAQAYDGPERAAQGAATADTTTEEPLDIQGQGLLQYAIDATDGRFEFLRRDSWE